MALNIKIVDSKDGDTDPLLEEIFQEAEDRLPYYLNAALEAFSKDKNKTFNSWRRNNLVDFVAVDLYHNMPDSTIHLAKMIVESRIDDKDPVFISNLTNVITHIAAMSAAKAAIDNHRRELDEQAEVEE